MQSHRILVPWHSRSVLLRRFASASLPDTVRVPANHLTVPTPSVRSRVTYIATAQAARGLTYPMVPILTTICLVPFATMLPETGAENGTRPREPAVPGAVRPVVADCALDYPRRPRPAHRGRPPSSRMDTVFPAVLSMI